MPEPEPERVHPMIGLSARKGMSIHVQGQLLQLVEQGRTTPLRERDHLPTTTIREQMFDHERILHQVRQRAVQEAILLLAEEAEDRSFIN